MENVAKTQIIGLQEIPFIHSSRFENEKQSIDSYDKINNILRNESEITVGAYRIFQNWQEEGPSNKPWFIIVLGDIPPEPIAKEILTALKKGEIAPLPDEIIAEFAKRTLNRREEMEITNKSYW